MGSLLSQFICVVIIIFILPINSFSADINIQSISDVVNVSKEKKMKYAWISIDGNIVNGDYIKFKSTISNLLDNNIVVYTVTLNSPGGDVMEAMMIGKLIRGCLLTTWAPDYRKNVPLLFCKTKDKICKGNFEFFTPSVLTTREEVGPPKEPCCTCDSSCFLIWAGGVVRYGHMIRIHRPYFDQKYFSGLNPSKADLKYKEMSKFVREYLFNMDIPTAVIDKMYQFSSEQIHLVDQTVVDGLIYAPFYQEWQKNLCKNVYTDEEKQEWSELKKTKDNNEKLSKTLEDAYQLLESKRYQYYECLFAKRKAAQMEAIANN